MPDDEKSNHLIGNAARRIYLLGGAVLLFVAGDEASRGQHLFNLPVPGLLQEINEQQELNIHNIRGLDVSPLAGIFQQSRLVLGMLAAEAVFYNSQLAALPELPFHQSNILLTLLAVFMVVSGRARALPSVIAAIAVVAAVAYSMTQIRVAVTHVIIY